MSNSSKITIHSVIDANTIPFYQYLIKNYKETAEKPELLQFVCHTLDRKSASFFAQNSDVYRVERPYRNIFRYRCKTLGDLKCIIKSIITFSPHLGGSNGHAQGLNNSVKFYKSLPGIHIIADSDTVMLQYGWDATLRTELQKADIFGAPYEDIGGFSSGTSKVQTYKKFPSGVWVALGERINWANLNWMPAKERNTKVVTKKQSARYNLPIGYEVVRDVGWELPDYTMDRDGIGKALTHVKPSSTQCKALRTGFDYHEEYQLNGQPFLGHHRGSRQFAFRNCEMSSAFYDNAENYLKGEKE